MDKTSAQTETCSLKRGTKTVPLHDSGEIRIVVEILAARHLTLPGGVSQVFRISGCGLHECCIQANVDESDGSRGKLRHSQLRR